MLRVQRARTSGRALVGALVIIGTVLLSPALAVASLSQPWAATGLDGAQAIASGHGRYVVVGSTGLPPQAAVWTSANGLSWDRAVVPELATSSVMTEVTTTEDGFVAVGVASDVEGRIGGRAHAWWSPDGLEWDDATLPSPSRSGYRATVDSLADASAGQLALGSFVSQGPNGGDRGGQRLWHTTDGLTWERVRLPRADGYTWNGVVAVPQGYLLLGQSLTGQPYNWRSADGTTWKRLRGTPQLYDVAVSDSGALVGMGYQDLWRSPKGLRDWRNVMTRPAGWKTEGANAFSSVAWDGSEFVVVGRDVSSCDPGQDCELNPVLVSLRGSTWSEAAGPDGLPGADEGTLVKDVASLDDSTVVLGLDQGVPTVWTIGGATE